MDKKTKDYIYLDEDLLNSHLAQFEKGLLTKEKIEHGVESADSTGGSIVSTLGINGIFGIGAKLQNEISENDNSLESEFTKNMMENVLSDYAVDLLIGDCDSNGLLMDLTSSNEGDFVLFGSEFQIYDFEYLKNITDLKTLDPILGSDPALVNPGSQASKQAKEEYKLKLQKHNKEMETARNGFKLVNDFSTFANILFDDSVPISLNGGLAICKRDKMRLNKAQISFENESNRKLLTFGVVSTTKKENPSNSIHGAFSTNQLDKVPSIIFDILLSSFNMLHSGDKIIKPIAIYFEAE